jgi:hypothetical protein
MKKSSKTPTQLIENVLINKGYNIPVSGSFDSLGLLKTKIDERRYFECGLYADTKNVCLMLIQHGEPDKLLNQIRSRSMDIIDDVARVTGQKSNVSPGLPLGVKKRKHSYLYIGTRIPLNRPDRVNFIVEYLERYFEACNKHGINVNMDRV